MHRRLCKQVNCSCWQVTGGQSGGSSLPSRQSGEKSHFHFSGMHFWPSAHWKTSGSLQSKLTSSLWPCTMAKHNNSNMNLIIMLTTTSWTGATFLQTEEKLDASDSRRSRPSFRPRRRRRFMLCGWQLFEPLRLKNFFFLGFLRSNFPMTISLVWIINGLPLKKQQDSSSSSHLSEFFRLFFSRAILWPLLPCRSCFWNQHFVFPLFFSVKSLELLVCWQLFDTRYFNKFFLSNEFGGIKSCVFWVQVVCWCLERTEEEPSRLWL